VTDRSGHIGYTFYEGASLSYTGISKREDEDIGLYDTTITRRDALRIFEEIR